MQPTAPIPAPYDDSPGAVNAPPGNSLNVPAGPSTFAQLTADLRPEVRRLAECVTASEPNAMILSFFRQHPQIALTSPDLAVMVDLPSATVTGVLAEWTATGLIEGLTAGGLRFYRLTRDPVQLQALTELVAWREYWVAALWNVAHAVDPRLYAPQPWNGHLASGKPDPQAAPPVPE